MSQPNGILKHSLLAAAVSSAALQLPALAQEPPPEEGSAILEEVIVTARRRAESLQDSSLIIEAMTGQKLQEQRISNLVQFADQVPSLQVGAAGPALQVYIRGVGNATSTAFGSMAIAVSKDGVFIPRAPAIAANFYDLERVEVLKGPQGTLYGRNATGGAINLLTNRPDLEATSGYVAGDLGNFDRVQLEGAVNVPLSDNFAVRASGYAIDRDGYMSDGTTDDDHWSGRLQTLWEPTDRISWTVQGQYSQYDGRGPGFTWAGSGDAWESLFPRANDVLLAGIMENGLTAPSVAFPWIDSAPVLGPAPTPPFPPGTDIISLVGFIEDDIEQDMTFWDINTTFEWDFDFATLTVVAGYQDSEMFYNSRPSVNIALTNVLDNGAPETSEVASLEMRLGGETDNLSWVGGVFLFNEEQAINNRVNQGIIQSLQIVTDYETDALGVFGEVTYRISDKLALTGGLRYSDDEQVKSDFNRYAIDESIACPPNSPTASVINGVLACRISGPETEKVTSDSVDWKAGIEYSLSDDSLLFFTVSTGYKAGGIPAVSGSTYDPEELTAWSLGMKNVLMNGRLKLNGDLFYWDYEGRQENLVAPDATGIVGLNTVNTGESTIQGVAMELEFAATAKDFIRFNIEYLDAEYDEFVYEQAAAFTPPTTCATSLTGVDVPTPGGPSPELRIDCSGFEMTKAPDLTFFAEYIHTFDLGASGELDARVTAAYTDGRWLTANFLPEQRVDEFTFWNASLAYRPRNQKFTAIAYVDNLTEEESFQVSLNHTQVPQLVGLQPGPPRTYGLRLTYNF
ncbi:MAG: TonB-dependent receptor [Pseudomonadota bacterium]